LAASEFLDAGDDEADFACAQFAARQRLRREHADLLAQMNRTFRHQQDPVLARTTPSITRTSITTPT